MMRTGLWNKGKMGPPLLAWLVLAPLAAFGQAIESGQYFSTTLSTNNTVDAYAFYVQSNDTVVCRTVDEDDLYSYAADMYIYSTNNGLQRLSTNQYLSHDISMRATNTAWYWLYAVLPTPLWNISNSLSYSISMLRLPNAPLSYADRDVGVIQNGESIEGTIDVGADLDAATINVTNECTVEFRMGQKDYVLVPNIQVYSPSGTLVTNYSPVEYRAELTLRLTSTGIYTYAASDKFNAAGDYAMSMAQMPGYAVSSNDTDIGAIVNGEAKTGKINKPGDLDVATFSVYTGDVVKIVLSEIDPEINPVLELFDPSGYRILSTSDVFQQQVTITNAIATNGTHYLICKDMEDRYDVKYQLALTLLSGPSASSIPAVPTGIAASDGTYSNYVQITWSASTGALSYDLWRSYGTNESAQLGTNFTSPSFNDSNASAGITYYYKARARNDYGVSDFSSNDAGYVASSLAVTSGVRYALLVGIDNYSPSFGLTPLNTCTNDATGIKNTLLLGDPSNRWAAGSIYMYTDSQATKSAVRLMLQSLASLSSAGDVVLYFHSSHGGTAGGYDTYLAAYDLKYTDAELGSDLARFRTDTKVIVIVDACYAGGLYQLRDDGTLTPDWPFAERVMEEYQKAKTAEYAAKGLAAPKALGNNIAFLTASAYDELSYTSDFYSLYTKYLLAGCSVLTVDTNFDRQYQFLELHSYAKTQANLVQPSQNAQTYNTTVLQNTIARSIGSNALSGGGTVVKRQRLDNDYDGDYASDLALYNASAGQWYVGSLYRLAYIAQGISMGGAGYTPVTGDYDGDSKADLALYKESTGQWIIGSLARQLYLASNASWGAPGYLPVVGDYNGDGVCDLAVYREDDGMWYVISMYGTLLQYGKSFTGSGFTATPGDFNGDSASDYAMYHEQSAYWYIISGAISTNVSTNIVWGQKLGATGYLPVAGDYDGDMYSDLALYSQSSGQWYVYSVAKSANITWGASWGGSGYAPVPGDYNADGKADLAVYNESAGTWYIRYADGSRTNAYGLSFGGPGYVPATPAP